MNYEELWELLKKRMEKAWKEEAIPHRFSPYDVVKLMEIFEEEMMGDKA